LLPVILEEKLILFLPYFSFFNIDIFHRQQVGHFENPEYQKLIKLGCHPTMRELVHKAARDIVQMLIDSCIRSPDSEIIDIEPLKKGCCRVVYYNKDTCEIGWCTNIFLWYLKDKEQEQCVIVTGENHIKKRS
jgi:hypothetical protein